MRINHVYPGFSSSHIDEFRSIVRSSLVLFDNGEFYTRSLRLTNILSTSVSSGNSSS